jgi:hypothetical protein
MGRRYKPYGIYLGDFEHCKKDGFAIFEWDTKPGRYIGELRDELREKVKNLMLESGAFESSL